MLEFLVLGAMAVAGYTGGSGWLVLAGAAALTIGGWWRKLQLLREHPQVPFSTKMTTYFVAGVVANLLFSLAFLMAGRALRWWLES
jgi:hypothetical protein